MRPLSNVLSSLSYLAAAPCRASFSFFFCFCLSGCAMCDRHKSPSSRPEADQKQKQQQQQLFSWASYYYIRRAIIRQSSVDRTASASILCATGRRSNLIGRVVRHIRLFFYWSTLWSIQPQLFFILFKMVTIEKDAKQLNSVNYWIVSIKLSTDWFV